jgi:hypothetical protein
MDRSLGVLSYLLLAVLALTLADAGFGLLEPANVIRVVSGGSTAVSGELDSPAEDIRSVGRPPPGTDLSGYVTIRSDSPDMHLVLSRIRGRLWNGRLTVDGGARSGIFSLSVHQRFVPPAANYRPFEVRVFPDREALQEDLPTFSERLLGVKPYWLTLVCLPAVAGLLFLSYRRARQRDRLYQERGFGVIHTLSRKAWGYEITFGLGRRQGVEEGEPLVLLDAEGRVLTEFVPRLVKADFGKARIKPTVPVTTDCLVMRRKPGADQDAGNLASTGSA